MNIKEFNLYIASNYLDKYTSVLESIQLLIQKEKVSQLKIDDQV